MPKLKPGDVFTVPTRYIVNPPNHIGPRKTLAEWNNSVPIDYSAHEMPLRGDSQSAWQAVDLSMSKGVFGTVPTSHDPLNVAEESLAVTCPHCGHTSDVRIPARPVVSSPAAADKA